MVEKNLSLTFFVTGDVLCALCGEFSEFFPARHGRGFTQNKRGQQSGTRGASAEFRAGRSRGEWRTETNEKLEGGEEEKSGMGAGRAFQSACFIIGVDEISN